jgi:ferredoxin
MEQKPVTHLWKCEEASKEQVLANLEQAKEHGLVLNADNVKRNPTFICFCCKCCCNAMAGISKHGYPNSIVTSNYIAEHNDQSCIGCGKCAQVCPIDAIEMIPNSGPESKGKKTPKIDKSMCLGCGVCGLACPFESIKLIKREKRVITPETVFQKVLLSSLERGTLQNQIFDNPQSVTQKFLRGFIGGFLRLPPVKRALLGDKFRSRFLNYAEKGFQKQGKDWLINL